MLPENLCLDEKTVSKLFPFHLLIDVNSDRSLLSAGSSIQRLLPDDYLQHSFDDLFTISRPDFRQLTMEFVNRHTDSIVFVKVTGTDTILRGQLIAKDEGLVLFLGTLLVNAASSLESSGFSLADFAPCDTTPEIVILQRFREIQVKGMEKQNRKLQSVIEARDTFDAHANTDSLTGIANRRGFRKIGAKWLEKKRHSVLAVLMLDLDGLKTINDNYGHEAGDSVLQIIASRLSDALKAEGLPGRLGGDEFVAIVEAADENKLEQRVNEILEFVAKPVFYRGIKLKISLSSGAVVADFNTEMDQLISHADIAMYQGRINGRGSISWFTAEIRKKHEYDKRLTRDLELAIYAGQIKPFFQRL